ncbi:serine/arginine repetitive matrix protein 1-like isoform X2 [Neodiprion fabricii]|uniref:serine/arginine repetitive matrix protein 1-like isoform X2 n=1 Tax=Neodiprion fabricii TaxID=2872261 RepID=UPI001ED958C3|nr:serine/arginine repetitive matrix protein 1-like isoform X2 [Neodiprion fabricii]
MEISKSLQDEIHSVQNKLKYAIQNHQVYVGKLNDDPNNDELLGQLHEIQEHIISLSKCQKQVVQRLRKEVKLYEAANSNGGKVSIGSLLGLNNNDSITNNNVTKSRETEQTVNGNNFNALSRRLSKDDYEDEIQNVDPPSPNHHFRNNCPRERTRFNRIDSNDKDIVEIETDENSTEKPIPDDMYRDLRCEQQNFLGCLGLITADKHRELQNKRAERKRRSTANPQFVYSNWEIPTKRKRHSYLQSNGTAPQTRQTTARLNGPSPPPSKVGRLKSSSPPCAASAKSLIPTQKSSTRPNILRNNQESKVFAGKTKSENNLSHKQQSNAKSVTSVGGKAVHIPGLPSSLTIERIENICRAVCVLCRKSDSTLEVCEVCGTYFHATCHVASSPTFRTCPKCTTKTEESDCDQNSSDTLAIETKREIEIEEKERDRYELRERNSDLRLQVYELEKRSQLLGQSLQQQHRTRQEMLGKQEKTQRSIKRLVDFIKLMQQQNDPSQQPSASTSFHPQPSLSLSSRTPSPPPPSPPRSPLPPRLPHSTSISLRPLSHLQHLSTVENQTSARLTPQFSSTNSHDHQALSRTPRSPTPTSFQSQLVNKKNHSLTSSSKKSPNHQKPQQEVNNYHHHQSRQQSPEINLTGEVLSPPLSTLNNLQMPVRTTMLNQTSSLLLSENYWEDSKITTDKSLLSHAKIHRQNLLNQNQQTVLTVRSASSNSTLSSTSTSSEHQDNRTVLYPSTVLLAAQKLSTNLMSRRNHQKHEKSDSPAVNPSPIVQKPNQKQIYSTHCSQAITSPIPSPVVLSSRKIQPQNKSNQNSNSNHLKIANRNATNSNLEFILPPSQISQNT